MNLKPGVNRRGRIRFNQEQEAEITARLQSGETTNAVAKAMGVNWRSVKTRQKALMVAGAARLVGKPGAAQRPLPVLPSIAHEREITRLRDEVSALKKRNADLHRASVDDDAIREILTGMARHESPPPDWLSAAPAVGKSSDPTAQVPVCIWSDWHVGEVVQASETHGLNGYSITIAEERIARIIDTTLSICRDHGPKVYPGAVVPLLGDFVSGGLHPELLATDEAEVIPAALRAADMIADGLRRMAGRFGRIYAPAVCGNHGRATPKPQFKRYVFKNFDFLIYEMVRAKLADDSRIVIDHRSENDVHFRIYGMRFAATHGDMMGVKGGDGIIGALGPIMRGEIKTGKQMAAIGRDYDVLLMGHWHQMLWLPRAIVSGSIKGWDEYARLSLRAPYARPSQPLFFVHPRHGITSRWEIMADADATTVQEPEWVGWRG